MTQEAPSSQGLVSDLASQWRMLAGSGSPRMLEKPSPGGLPRNARETILIVVLDLANFNERGGKPGTSWL